MDGSSAVPLFTASVLFQSQLVRIEHVVAHPRDSRPVPYRELDHHAVVLPYDGVFTTHFGARRSATVTPSHAALLPARTPVGYSFPCAVGDQCIVLGWAEDTLARVAPEALRSGSLAASLANPAPLLTPPLLLRRERLRTLAISPLADPLDIDERALALLEAVLSLGLREVPRERGLSAGARARHRRIVERAKERVALDPARAWTLDALAADAAASPRQLARAFRAETGVSTYEYVVRTRLAAALQRVLDGAEDLATIAADAGFSSHSHFTARFRSRFGCTPSALRHERGRPDRGVVRTVTAESYGAA